MFFEGRKGCNLFGAVFFTDCRSKKRYQLSCKILKELVHVTSNELILTWIFLFFQLTFFFNPDWSTYVCGADEIRDYQKSIVNNFGLQGHISFNTGVKKATWDEISSKWTIETDTNETFQVTHLISGCGVLRTPNIPNFKGPENSIHFFEYVLW